VIAVAEAFPELAVQGVMMRKYGQEIIKATAGKKVHGTGAIPGGINKNLSIAERDGFLAGLDQQVAWARSALEIAKNYTVENLDKVKDFGSFDSNHVGLVKPNGAMDLYHGLLRAVDAQGNKIFDMEPTKYVDFIVEEVRPWSYMKFPFLKRLGPEHGWYRVGPLARLNTCSFIPTPEAEAARREFMGLTKGKPNNITMCYHWARMIELLHAIEVIRDLLHDPDLQGDDLVTSGPRREETVGVVEAPRGTLFHHYRVGANDAVTMCNLIVSTTNNNEPMNRAVTKVARDHFSGKSEITEGLLNHIEVAIRAYDPCLSCATHAMGRMALLVEVLDACGEVLDRRLRGGA
jgi:NAD-reducing hydrogenase large subunit